MVVVGLGNRMRGDDAAGPEVARLAGERDPALRAVEHEREPTGLLELWAGADLAIVIDAIAGGEPGTVHRFEVGSDPLPARLSPPASTHAFDLAETIELARSLDRMPRRLLVYGIEGASFETGRPLSAAVAKAVREVARQVAEESPPPPR